MREVRRAVFEFAKTLIVAFVLAQVIMISVAQAFQVEQFSMEPNLLPHDRVLVNKFIYRLREPHAGEIIILHPPTDPARNYIKRVVATSGQRVWIRDGRVYINGGALPEPYLSIGTAGEFGPRIVPPHEVFVLGDNRPNSEDSRSFGFVPDRNIIGEAVLIYWPPDRLRLLK